MTLIVQINDLNLTLTHEPFASMYQDIRRIPRWLWILAATGGILYLFRAPLSEFINHMCGNVYQGQTANAPLPPFAVRPRRPGHRDDDVG
jgi:hypothetical protein